MPLSAVLPLMAPTFLPMGDCGIRVAFGDEISPRIGERVQRFCRRLESVPVAGVTEWVPGYATVTVYYQPWCVSYQSLCDELRRLGRRRGLISGVQGSTVEIPICYDGAFGPDLDAVADAHGLRPADVIQRHVRPLYRVYFLGFLPGFAYLGGLLPSLVTSRRSTPRTAVPAGSVGIAGAQTGVYPLESPGGWQIIGRTPMCLFDPEREPPALLRTGDRVKFVAITAEEYEERARGSD